MLRRAGLCIIAVLALVTSATAQVNVRGQILLPDGNLPQERISFSLESGDGSLHDIRFTDSNGRFILERLGGSINYTITVESDGISYDRTSYSFVPQYQSSPRITLLPFTRKTPVAGKTISAASGYRPNPKAADAHEAGLKEVKKQQFDAAEQHFRKAIEADPKYVPPLIDLGALLIQGKRYAESEKVLRQAVQVDSKSTLALLNLGIALNRQEKFADAIPFLREALRLEPGLTPAHLQLGAALLATEKFTEAEPQLLGVIKTGGTEEILGQMYLGQLYARTGQLSKSIAAFEIYLQKAPNATNAAEVRSLIEKMKKECGPQS